MPSKRCTGKPISLFKGFALVDLVATRIINALSAAIGRSRSFAVGVFQPQGYFDEMFYATHYSQKHAVATGSTARANHGVGFTRYRPATHWGGVIVPW